MHFQNIIPHQGLTQNPSIVVQQHQQAQQVGQSRIRRITLDHYQSSPIRVPIEETAPTQTITRRVVTTTQNESSMSQQVHASPHQVSYKKYYDMNEPMPNMETPVFRKSETQHNQVIQQATIQPFEGSAQQHTSIQNQHANMQRTIRETLPQVQVQNTVVLERNRSSYALHQPTSIHTYNPAPRPSTPILLSQHTRSPQELLLSTNEPTVKYSVQSRESGQAIIDVRTSELSNIIEKVHRMEGEMQDLRHKNQHLLDLVSLQNNYEQMLAAKNSETFSSNGHVHVRKSVRVNAEEASKQSEEIQKLAAELNELKLKNEELTSKLAKAENESKKAEKLKEEHQALQQEMGQMDELKLKIATLEVSSKASKEEFQTYIRNQSAREEALVKENNQLKAELANDQSDNTILQYELKKLDDILQNEPSKDDFEQMQQHMQSLQQQNSELHEAYRAALRDGERKAQQYSINAEEILEAHLGDYRALEKAYLELKEQRERMAEGFEQKERELESTVELLRKKLENMSVELEELSHERNELIEQLHQKEQTSDQGSHGDEIVVINEIEHLEQPTPGSPTISHGEPKISHMISKEMNLESSNVMMKNTMMNMETELNSLNETINKQLLKIEKLKSDRFEVTMRLLFTLSEVERLQSERPFRGL